MSLFNVAFSLFLLMDPLGNVPLFITFLKNVEAKRQRYVIFREMVIALGIIIVFSFLGNTLMDFLKVTEDTIQISGGLILFLIALKMIFPDAEESKDGTHFGSEPFIVPLAVPLVAGPSVLAAVMIYSRQEMNSMFMISAILLAWVASLIILTGSSFLKKYLGWRGIMALERLMGLILTLIAIQMFLSGLALFAKDHL